MSPESAGEKPLEIYVDDTIMLRGITVADSEALFSLIDRNREHLSQNGDDTAEKYPTLESVIERAENQGPNEHRFGIWDGDILVGFIKLTESPTEPVELGYWLGSEYQGRGYMTKAVQELTRYAINTLGHWSVIAKVNKQNVASLKVLGRLKYAIIGNVPDKPDQFCLQYFPWSGEERLKRRGDGYRALARKIERLVQNDSYTNATLEIAGAIDGILDDMRYEGDARALIARNEEVLRLRYGLDDGVRRTLNSVGEITGVTRERVRQIEMRAISMMRSRIREAKRESH